MLEFASTPVVVLNCGHHAGLAIMRSLGRSGVPVYAVHPERATPAFFSRYCHKRILWDVHSAAGAVVWIIRHAVARINGFRSRRRADGQIAT